jgi:hypothetical protein
MFFLEGISAYLGDDMKTIFLSAAFLLGFSWKMLASATVLAAVTYGLVRLVAGKNRKHLAWSVAWAVWFVVIAEQLFKSAAVSAYVFTGVVWQGFGFAGFVVALLAGLWFLLIRSSRRWLRIASVFSAFLVIGAVGLMPLPRAPQAAAEQPSFPPSFYLYKAALDGNINQIKALVEQGVDIEEGTSGLTPLYGAAYKRRLEAAEVLLDLGADINSTNGPAQRTPLHQAVLNGDVPMIALLLKRGASVTAKTTHGRTPLDYAIDPPFPLTKPENSEQIAEMLRAAGAQ